MQTKVLDGALRKQIFKEYKAANERIIFLDYDGTLVGFFGDPAMSKPDEELKKLLKALTADKKNHVVIISGRDRNTLKDWLEDYNLEIVAEHGAWIRRSGADFKPAPNLENVWVNKIKIVLDDYVNRTPGSFVEEKDYSLVWHYRKVETGLGEVRARELSSHLKYITNSQNLQVMEGDKVIEIKNSEVNKGKGAKRILKGYRPDFVLACGDDRTDEDTFLALPAGSHSIKIGAGASAAKYSVSDFTKIRTLLFELTKR